MKQLFPGVLLLAHATAALASETATARQPDRSYVFRA